MHLSFFLTLITKEDGPILPSDKSTTRKRNMLVMSHQLELRSCHKVSPMEHVLLMGGSFTTTDGSRTSLTNLHMSEAQQHSRIWSHKNGRGVLTSNYWRCMDWLLIVSRMNLSFSTRCSSQYATQMNQALKTIAGRPKTTVKRLFLTLKGYNFLKNQFWVGKPLSRWM